VLPGDGLGQIVQRLGHVRLQEWRRIQPL
jgi:hypothetical protein